MKHLGDITKINGHDVPIVDIITGGSPCQDLSVAGKRAGLAGERSGLFMEQIRIIKEMHDECRLSNDDIRPRYMVWENVPGAFSSNGGEDFRAVLEETAKVAERNASIPRLEKWPPSGCIMGNGWSIAWRLHDAQFWGVPQRRKRIALVADFRGQTAPEILFERKGLSGNTEESGKEREGTSDSSQDGSAKAISFLERAGCEGGARESLSRQNGLEPSQHSITNQSLNCDLGGKDKAFTMQAFGQYSDTGVASSLKQRDHKDATDLVVGSFYPQMKAESQCYREDGKSNTLVNGTNPGYQNAVVYGLDRASFNQGQNAQYDFSVQEELAQTLVAKGPGGVLTPLEHCAQETTKE